MAVNMEKKSDNTRIAVFASGSGTNAENIIRYFQEQGRGAEVALVVCNRKGAQVFERAERLGVPAEYVPKSEFADRGRVLSLLDGYRIDFIVLAGFLLVVPEYLIERYRGRIVNIHPSLLPAYGGRGMYGMHVHEAVVAAREAETGITIHHVSEHCDEGEIICQARVPLTPDDTPDTVAAKVHALEYEHYPRVIATLLPTR